MSTGQFNNGRDVSLDIIGPNGAVIIALITKFDSKQKTKDLESAGIDGVTRQEYIPDGWDISFEFDRANRAADDMIAALEAAYYAGQRMVHGTITQTVQEIDGSISQWRYENCAFKMDDAGSWSKDAKVSPKLSGFASFKRKVL